MLMVESQMKTVVIGGPLPQALILAILPPIVLNYSMIETHQEVMREAIIVIEEFISAVSIPVPRYLFIPIYR